MKHLMIQLENENTKEAFRQEYKAQTSEAYVRIFPILNLEFISNAMAPRRSKQVAFQSSSSSRPQQDPKPRSLLKLIKSGIKHLGENGRKKKGGKNSRYTGRYLDLNDVKVWEDFISIEDVESLWQECAEIRDVFYEVLAPEDQGRCIWESPVSGGMLNEMCLERKWDSILDQLNLAFELCAKAEQKNSSPLYVKIADGANATHISPNAEEHAARKKPDYAGFFYGDDSQYLDTNITHNRIPGDAKVFQKISREMLPPNGKKFKPGKKNIEALKVLSQIHGYMDQHEARYGYIVNNEELVFFRRRDDGWGQLDISPAIRHDVDADASTGVLNSKYVLFYFHWKVARDTDSKVGWRLRSFGKDPNLPAVTVSPPPALDSYRIDPYLAKKASEAISTANSVQRLLPTFSSSLRQRATLWLARLTDFF